MGRVDSELRDRVIFVVGARRSGTNWLERILTAHPEVVAMPSETYLFSHGIAPLTERFQHANPGSPMVGRTFMERESFLDALRELVDRIFCEHLERAGPDARYLLERTPWHASHLDLIAEVYPDARVIHIVRDGRAVARSLLSMGWGPKTMADAAREWRQAVHDAREGGRAFGDRYLEIGYERLLADQRARAEELFEWLGLEVPEDRWRRILVESETGFNVDGASPKVDADKWRQELSDPDVRTFERIAGAQLHAYGYQRVGAGTGASVRRALAARTTGLAAARLRYLAEHWRPLPAARAMLSRAEARRSKRTREEKLRIVALFERNLAEGRRREALEMLTPKANIRIVDGTDELAGRGGELARQLLARLDEHRSQGMRTLSGHLHASSVAFTSVVTYELGDGSRWARTLVFRTTYPRITAVAMYRFQLEAQVSGSVLPLAAASAG